LSSRVLLRTYSRTSIRCLGNAWETHASMPVLNSQCKRTSKHSCDIIGKGASRSPPSLLTETDAHNKSRGDFAILHIYYSQVQLNAVLFILENICSITDVLHIPRTRLARSTHGIIIPPMSQLTKVHHCKPSACTKHPSIH
jgi:hypothetical protein